MRSRVFLKLFRIAAYNILRQPELSVQILLQCKFSLAVTILNMWPKFFHILESKELLCDCRVKLSHTWKPIVIHWKLKILILNTIRVRKADLIPMKSMPRDKVISGRPNWEVRYQKWVSQGTELTEVPFHLPPPSVPKYGTFSLKSNNTSSTMYSL